MKNRMTEKAFLEDRIGLPVAIYLIGGIRLLGVLDGHHREVIFLRSNDAPGTDAQMIRKNAISTITLDTLNFARNGLPAALDGVLSKHRRRPRSDQRELTRA